MLRCATTNSMPCCCRRTCSYGLQVLLALEWDTNPTRDIEMRPHEGPSSPCARSAACLSFQCVAMRSAGSVLGAPGYFGLRFEWPLLTGFSTGHQFGRLFFLCWQTAAASMAEERKATLSQEDSTDIEGEEASMQRPWRLSSRQTQARPVCLQTAGRGAGPAGPTMWFHWAWPPGRWQGLAGFSAPPTTAARATDPQPQHGRQC